MDKTAVLNIRFVASDNDSRAKGLMFADPLADDEVAFFVFPTNNRYSFWNKNVPFGLTLAFLDENGRIVEFADMDAQSTEPVCPTREARYVIEAAKGAFEKAGICTGDIVNYSSGKLHVTKLGEISKSKEVSG